MADRTLVFGDVHGCSQALRHLLDLVKPTKSDLLVFLGDYIDRGPDSKGVVDLVLELRERHELVALRGNHEIGMLQAREDSLFAHQWMGHLWGGGPTMRSYDAWSFEDVPQAHWEFFNTLEPWWETETHVFAHANLDPELPLADQTEEALYWQRFGGETEQRPHVSGKPYLVGHTPQRNFRPADLGFALCLDTHVYHPKGYLTCYEIESGIYYQAQETGKTRQGRCGQDQPA